MVIVVPDVQSHFWLKISSPSAVAVGRDCEPRSSYTMTNVTPPSPNNTKMQYWLMKAEPDSRVVKGKDVKVREVFKFKRISHF